MFGAEHVERKDPGLDLTDCNVHIPVMLPEVLSYVRTQIPNYIVVDMTLGRAGHASNILQKVGQNGFLYGFDRDEEAINFSYSKLSGVSSNFKLFHLPFSKAVGALQNNGVNGADFILFDIGVSSPQFDDPKRGFSYRFDAPLDMRMDESQALTAEAVVNEYSEKDLKEILWEYGGEEFAGPIAKAIVRERQKTPIKTTFQLVDVIKSALPERVLHKKGHPAKQTFMAIRYEVNDEKKELETALEAAVKFLNPGGRCVIITFNSAEDATAKKIFQSFVPQVVISRFLPPLPGKDSEYRILTKKPLMPDAEERSVNPRSESAKMRVIERK